MPPVFLHAPAPQPSEIFDRRLHRRYPIVLEVGYKLQNGVSVSDGAGRTLNISSGGIAFEADNAFTLGERIELRIQWPLLLNGLCPLILQMFGAIVRIDGKLICVETAHHEFRTARSHSTKVKHANA